ncbi:MAG TPA: hypothetical protein VKK79_06280 [Candidatus Lokiarchaeia archaeon]|nr:hypothetical protein [Candidatus Lokiarchaeia archaeon]
MKDIDGMVKPASRVRELFFYIALFGSVGFFGWGIRGTGGYGAIPGCVFAGIAWAMAWFLVSQVPVGAPTRRYSSGWVVLAIMVGIGIEGAHGWMQWPAWVRGVFYLNISAGTSLPINPAYGYLWTFIAAVPWAGMGAVLLAWTASQQPITPKLWVIRIACGVGGGVIASLLFKGLPQVFLPYYDLTNGYDPSVCVACSRVASDNAIALMWLGVYCGFLAFECGRKDWMNVKLIAIVGLLAGLTWMVFRVWNIYMPNCWRCWETCSGLGIGIALGVAFYVCNKPLCLPQPAVDDCVQAGRAPNPQRLAGFYLALVVGVFWSINGMIIGIAENDFSISGSLDLPVGLTCGIAGIGTFLYIYWREKDIRAPKPDLAQSWRIYWVAFAVQLACGLMVTTPLGTWYNDDFFAIYIALAVLDVVLLWSWKTRQKPIDRLNGD